MSVFDIISIGAAVGSIIWFGWIVSTGHDERHSEDDARAFYDEHGRWPDETPEQATAREADAHAALERAAASAQATREGAASAREQQPDDR
jgi:hypothetical protein